MGLLPLARRLVVPESDVAVTEVRATVKWS